MHMLMSNFEQTFRLKYGLTLVAFRPHSPISKVPTSTSVFYHTLYRFRMGGRLVMSVLVLPRDGILICDHRTSRHIQYSLLPANICFSSRWSSRGPDSASPAPAPSPERSPTPGNPPQRRWHRSSFTTLNRFESSSPFWICYSMPFFCPSSCDLCWNIHILCAGWPPPPRPSFENILWINLDLPVSKVSYIALSFCFVALSEVPIWWHCLIFLFGCIALYSYSMALSSVPIFGPFPCVPILVLAYCSCPLFPV